MSNDTGLDFQLNINKDNLIDLPNLRDEFRRMPIIQYRYSEAKSDAERDYDGDKARYEEMKSQVYVELKTSGEKYTENHLKAAIEIDPRVVDLKKKMLDSKRTYNTLKNYTESLSTKKDMLIQLGADMRKER